MLSSDSLYGFNLETSTGFRHTVTQSLCGSHAFRSAVTYTKPCRSIHLSVFPQRRKATKSFSCDVKLATHLIPPPCAIQKVIDALSGLYSLEIHRRSHRLAPPLPAGRGGQATIQKPPLYSSLLD